MFCNWGVDVKVLAYSGPVRYMGLPSVPLSTPNDTSFSTKIEESTKKNSAFQDSYLHIGVLILGQVARVISLLDLAARSLV